MMLRFVSLSLVVLFVACDGDSAIAPSATPPPSATADATVIAEPTVTATSEVTGVLDVTDRGSVAGRYEAMAWDDHRRLQRVPPPSVEVAEAEAEVHRAGYEFGASPASFEEVAGGDGCAVFEGEPRRAGDWMVSAVADSATRLRFEAREAMPPEPANRDGPFVLRLLSLDGEVERSHVYERLWGNPLGVFEWEVRLPVAGRWLAVATAGPNWGCFELTVDQGAEFPSSVAEAEGLGAAYRSMVASAERVAYFDGRLGEANTEGSFERRCLDADGLAWAAAGEFLARLDQLTVNWTPNRRISKVAWTPLHGEELEGGLLLTMTLVGAPEHTYSYFERFPVQSATSVDGLTSRCSSRHRRHLVRGSG